MSNLSGKSRPAAKMAVDLAMTAALLLLMPYELIGQAFHEWTGCAMFLLFLIHHALNRRPFLYLFKGKHTAAKLTGVVLDILILCSMLGSMVSGIVLSRSVFRELDLGGTVWARPLHMFCAYFGFVLMSVHIGLHWSMMIGRMKKRLPPAGNKVKTAVRLLTAMAVGYGIYAFIRRDFLNYLLMQNRFANLDYSEPVILLLIDYIAIMVLFIAVGHYLNVFLRKAGKRTDRTI